jgi:hypothetical protein
VRPPDAAPQRIHHVAALSEVEAVERLVHQQNRVPRQKSERDDEAAIIALGEGVNALHQDRAETNG